ncbi:hypothetical protein [Aquibacillus saliphilus]|uniref:hypothetical protein n=1 Tax=Aquibacillus saliphilus TaxID=1909422 RepID=UPI001CF0765A|nr:hypothetical protein [Aquibacillus saliphilus]
MEILAHGSQWGEYVFVLAILSISGIFLASLLLYALVDSFKDGWDKDGTIAMLFIAGLLSLIIWGLIGTNEQGVTEYWKVRIIDFNEIYEKDYKIVDQEGVIYKIVKND